MPFQVLPATIEDAEPIARILTTAWDEHPVLRNLHPNTDPEVQYEYELVTIKKLLSQDSVYGGRMFKAVDDETSTILGFTRWVIPTPHLTPSQLEQRWHLMLDRSSTPSPGTNTALSTAFHNALDTHRRKFIEPSSTYFLHLLCVGQQHQRKGVGRRLLEDMLAVVDADGRESYVEASMVGEKLYVSLGWRECGVVGLRLGELGVEGEDGVGETRFKLLMREAK